MLDSLTAIPSAVIADYLKMALEIFILTVVIYKTLYYLRGARGASVLAGITVLLLVLTWLSKLLHLDVINWLLTGIWGTLGAAMVIIFQPELRRAFAQLGSFSFFQGKRRREVLTEIVTAVGNMAHRKCGAILVIERRIGLQNLVDDAVRLDVKLNAMILESIFYPNSPLHDGAVIIRSDRIVAARAILPLTRAQNISVRLGTRHRAALGISEDTDAVTVVVSEETGSISVAYRGALHRDLSPDELANYLEKLIILKQGDSDLAETIQMLEEQASWHSSETDEEEKSSDRKRGKTQNETAFDSFTHQLYLLMRRDVWRKFIALFFAIMLYFYVHNEVRSTSQKVDHVPVDIVLPQELMDVDPRPQFVTLNIKSNRNTSISASMLRGRVVAEYSRYIPGNSYVFSLKPDNFSTPLGVQIVDIDPNEIVLNLQQRVTRDVPVRVTFSNRLSPDYKSSLANCVPATVRVTGPKQLVDGLKSVSTQPVPLSEAVTEGFEYVAVLEAPAETTLSPTKVTCQIDVEKNYEQRIFQALPLQLLTPIGGKPFTTEVLGSSRVEVTVRGLAGSVAALSPGEVWPYLDISHIDKPGIYEISAGCYVKGDGLDVSLIRPALIKIKITE